MERVKSDDPSITSSGPVDVGPTTTQIEQKTPSDQGTSTLEKSTKEHQQDPGTIALIPPSISTTDYTAFLQNNFMAAGMSSVSLTQAISELNNEQSKTVNKMWSDYQQSLQKIFQDDKHQRDMASRRTEHDHSSSHQAVHKAAENFKDAPPVMTSLLVISASFIGAVGAATLANSVGSIAFNPVQDSITAVASALPIPGDMRAELGLIGAMFAAGTIYPAALATLAQGTGGTNINMAFATHFAKQAIRTVTDTNFDNFMKVNVIGKFVNAAEIPPERAGELIAIVKVALLFNATALMTQVEAGHLTAEELVGIVQGTVTLPPGDPRVTMANLIRQQLGMISNVNERRSVIESLLVYFDSSPKLETLADPVNAIAAMFDEADSEKVVNQAV